MSKLVHRALALASRARRCLKAFLRGYLGLEPPMPASTDACDEIAARRDRRGTCC